MSGRIKGMPLTIAPAKRLVRPAEVPSTGFQFTLRDFLMVRSVARFRFLDANQIARIDGGSPAVVGRRLKMLWLHHFLDRPVNQHLQLASFADEGNLPLIYGLGRQGARVLTEHGLPINDKLDWTTKNKRAVALWLRHTLETAEAMLAFDFALKARNLQLLDHHDLLPYMPEATRKLQQPFRCRVQVRVAIQREPISVGVIPDRLFSVLYRNETRHNFALELDRGTMDLKAKQLIRKSSFRRKLLGYFHLHREEKHTSQWGFRGLRVLTITPSETRLQNIIELQREVVGEQGSNVFLFTTPDRIREHGILGPAWISGKSVATALITDEAS